jgi:hypothetical protein
MEWLNIILLKMWGRVAPMVQKIVIEQAKSQIQKQFAKSKPPAVVCIFYFIELFNVKYIE